MATVLSDDLKKHYNMVWEIKSPLSSSSSMLDIPGPGPEAGRDQGLVLLQCEEQLPSSPGCPTSDSHMEYDDLPELEEVEEDQTAPTVFQVGAGVSHQERDGHTQTHTAGPLDTHWLTQLAHIATGPQSPLLQGSTQVVRSTPVHIFGTSSNLHSYARPPHTRPPHTRPPLTSSSLPSRGQHRERSRRVRVSSECESAVSCHSSVSDDEDMGWSHSWPPTAWHCFLKGTRLRFHKGSSVEWQDAEELVSDEDSDDEAEAITRPLKGYGREGLRLVSHTESRAFGQSVLKLTFDPGACGECLLSSECQLDHPFYVRNKGWSSFYPSLTVVQYGIPCYEVMVGDVCLPPGHRDAVHTDDSLVFDTFRSYDFTPLDSSAVYVLSSMARQRRASQSAVSPDQDAHRNKPIKSQQDSGAAGGASPTKCKRPMNAFMLFAKKFRLEYTQMYPGKDNRAISVILGEKWKKMRGEERRMYTMEAKALADEQKRLNPDCWKRKRTNSGSQGN
ncbi:HMG box-containing protein 1 isoform X2 [Oncorhynchus mykiss]|uniref:HMG box-containing protein 1 isoform X2 n=1 Tax=Oncorhynchus mykiss TaxID=8022 RepID=UPI001877FF18|nr:HMG box-containing protein 1 isoform X2 [Oncorhynchus mykiss]